MKATIESRIDKARQNLRHASNDLDFCHCSPHTKTFAKKAAKVQQRMAEFNALMDEYNSLHSPCPQCGKQH